MCLMISFALSTNIVQLQSVAYAMEQRLSDWRKTNNSTIHQNHILQQTHVEQIKVKSNKNIQLIINNIHSQEFSTTNAEETITNLEIQVEQQRQLRIQEARHVEAKAARIKEWVTNKLRELEEQNQLLREQNQKCNQQLELLRNHIAVSSSRHSSILRATNIRNSLAGEVSDFSELSNSRRKSESLDPQLDNIDFPLTTSHNHRRELSMEPQELDHNLITSVDGINIGSLSQQSRIHRSPSSNSSDTDIAQDYAEIYTPSKEHFPIWVRCNDSNLVDESNTSSEIKTSSNSFEKVNSLNKNTQRPPTPPLHRFPSWEAKIYQVANDGLRPGDEIDEPLKSLKKDIGEDLVSCSSSIAKERREEQAISVGFCDISVPVYSTIKGRASQIRATPFTGDSSDDSSEGEEHAIVVANNSHNSSSAENTETSTSGSASSPSKSVKTSSSLSPAKRSDSESPKNTKQRVPSRPAFESGISDDYALPPDAVLEPIGLDNTTQLLIARSSYVDSPNRKIESFEKVGYLTKLGGRLKTWRKRWFVLKNGQLYYWKCQNDINRKPQGQILLDDACKIGKADGASTFEINTGIKTYYLTADSNTGMDEWIRVLQNVQRRNATRLLLSKDDQRPTLNGWVMKVKNGHSKRCWCVLLGRMFLYFKSPGESVSRTYYLLPKP
ncbi:uncharacterized protein CG43867-like isoform X2 [Condylostylus longicornis]|uniref:uncharacterized protein CG43867-like isoform X2 n=1 Tax=Condylostylus longicornis TaxID=2530218 RepID=UPI00244E28CE|nr:uncharacterized protein CG43867-like isoform X2 [Condylostylus longicornis]XP_055388063.1 uncharacterized protein CG43867-like isoform X2 [Condylostylus longicornis]